MRPAPHITVVGGANTDIIGIPQGAFELHDSIPGHVRVSPGGVGRNIAENLTLLGARVRLVTAFGDDADGRSLAAECEAAGIDTSLSIVATGLPGSRYLAVLDSRGGLAAAVNDMRALESLVPDALDPAAFAGADAVGVDTNLPPATLVRVAELAGETPVVLDPVSAPKSRAALPILPHLAAMKPNVLEAEALTGVTGARAAAERLVELGVGFVFVTMGPRGVWCASADESFELPGERATVVNVTGAGDAFSAGVAWGVATGMTLRETASFAQALSAITLASEKAVSDRVADARRAGTEGDR